MTLGGDGPNLPSLGGFRTDTRPVTPAPAPTPPPVLPAMVDLATTDVLCRRCQFNLRGLTPERNCPECGFSIQRTLAGDPLIFSSPRYLRTLSTGLRWILVATIVQIVMSFVAAGLAFAMAFTAGTAQLNTIVTLQMVSLLVGVPINLALLYGWWKFSTPDPDIAAGGGGDSGDGPRVIVRWATVLLVGAAMLASVVPFFKSDMMQIDLFSIGVGLFSSLAGIAQFFACLLYVRWIANRMQDAKLLSTVSLYLWLLPLIYILGACALGIGPIVALILYLVMLNNLRKGINFILAEQAMKSTQLEPA